MIAEQTPADRNDRHWFIVGRWQEYEGEARANLLRIVGIGAFYIVELINYYGLHLGVIDMPQVVDKNFHQSVTGLAVIWVMIAMAILLALRQRYFPALLKYVSSGCDLALLTAILFIADGPRSPLVVGYFLLIALAGLRFSLPLIWFTTGGAVGGYVAVAGYTRWLADARLRVELYHELIFLLALALTGLILGQAIRRVRGLARDYAARLAANQGARV